MEQTAPYLFASLITPNVVKRPLLCFESCGSPVFSHFFYHGVAVPLRQLLIRPYLSSPLCVLFLSALLQMLKKFGIMPFIFGVILNGFGVPLHKPLQQQ